MRPIQFFTALATFILLTLSSCTEDPCENSLCANGGVCIEGTCDCPQGFTGPSCSEQDMPDRIRLTSVQVTRFPGFNSDMQWDGTDGPDIYFRLYDQDQAIAQPMLLVEDADASQDYYFFINVIDMYNVTHQHRIQLLDYDGIDTRSDFLGEINFTPYHSTNGFPETILLDDGGPVAFTITVDYLYENLD